MNSIYTVKKYMTISVNFYENRILLAEKLMISALSWYLAFFIEYHRFGGVEKRPIIRASLELPFISKTFKIWTSSSNKAIVVLGLKTPTDLFQTICENPSLMTFTLPFLMACAMITID